ncbi:hypothetical protein Glove_283g138 [Diversispora epigaea]|uniref:t-SNARE coiled-coil homology domain-containing protein n=1 Tax=Diversispora epigaea TaxID=1348612 RepID=A0A397I2N7_9GLOM|nr:hypothetical protein Glove_283g138 [Diversispora epigaea]
MSRIENSAIWVNSIQDMIRSIKENLIAIQDLHKRILITLKEDESSRMSRQLDLLISETSRIGGQISQKLAAMEQNNKLFYQDQTQIRLSQHANLAKFFMDTMAEYRNLQMENEKKYKERIISQYKIVKPDVTEGEINELLGEKSGEFIISQLFSTIPTGQKRLIVSEIQDRHRDVHRIGKSINELNKMFSEVQALVIEQVINIPLTKSINIEELDKDEMKPDYLPKKYNERNWLKILTLIIIILLLTLIVLLIVFLKT